MHLIDTLNNMINKNQSVAMVTITKDTGSSPRGIGSMMLVNQSGLVTGSIGGGAIEHTVIKDAQQALSLGENVVKYYPLKDLDMTCGGDVEVFIKVFPAQEEVLIIGAGHICKAMIPILKTLNFRVSVIDHRDDIFENEVFEDIKIYNEAVDQALDRYEFSQDTYVVIVTHGHVFDELSLRICVSKPHKYIGMIGSRHKIKECFDAIINSGVSSSLLKEVYAPIGLTLGGETPEAIALSIISEIQCIKHEKTAKHYKEIKGVL